MTTCSVTSEEMIGGTKRARNNNNNNSSRSNKRIKFNETSRTYSLPSKPSHISRKSGNVTQLFHNAMTHPLMNQDSEFKKRANMLKKLIDRSKKYHKLIEQNEIKPVDETEIIDEQGNYITNPTEITTNDISEFAKIIQELTMNEIQIHKTAVLSAFIYELNLLDDGTNELDDGTISNKYFNNMLTWMSTFKKFGLTFTRGLFQKLIESKLIISFKKLTNVIGENTQIILDMTKILGMFIYDILSLIMNNSGGLLRNTGHIIKVFGLMNLPMLILPHLNKYKVNLTGNSTGILTTYILGGLVYYIMVFSFELAAKYGVDARETLEESKKALITCLKTLKTRAESRLNASQTATRVAPHEMLDSIMHSTNQSADKIKNELNQLVTNNPVLHEAFKAVIQDAIGKVENYTELVRNTLPSTGLSPAELRAKVEEFRNQARELREGEGGGGDPTILEGQANVLERRVIELEEHNTTTGGGAKRVKKRTKKVKSKMFKGKSKKYFKKSAKKNKRTVNKVSLSKPMKRKQNKTRKRR